MSTSIQAATEVLTITSSDIRTVFGMLEREIVTLTGAAKLPKDFNIESTMVDLSLMGLHGVLGGAKLEFYLGDNLIQSHTYCVVEGPQRGSGPEPTAPPLGLIGRMPEGARVRLVAFRAEGVAKELWQSWTDRLGWKTAKPLQIPPEMRVERYGSYVSGQYGLSRELAVNPIFDVPLRNSGSRTFADLAGKGL